jgi:hypothetical protein
VGWAHRGAIGLGVFLTLEIGAGLTLVVRVAVALAKGLPWQELWLLVSGGVQLLVIAGLFLGGLSFQAERGGVCWALLKLKVAAFGQWVW